MKRNVVITVKGLQPGMDAEPIEVISAGTYMRKENTHYLTFEEADERGKVTKNRIKITPDSIEMTKTGVITTQMLFLTGEKRYACYGTPYGEMDLNLQTKSITVKAEDTMVKAELRYGLEINGTYLSDCELDIAVEGCGVQNRQTETL